MKAVASSLAIAAALILGGCNKAPEPIFSGRVESIFYEDFDNSLSGISRLDKAYPGTSTAIHEDPWVDVYENWIIIRLKNRKDYTYVVPKDRVRTIIFGTEEGNLLNIPK
jgi:hypothetical protein